MVAVAERGVAQADAMPAQPVVDPVPQSPVQTAVAGKAVPKHMAHADARPEVSDGPAEPVAPNAAVTESGDQAVSGEPAMTERTTEPADTGEAVTDPAVPDATVASPVSEPTMTDSSVPHRAVTSGVPEAMTAVAPMPSTVAMLCVRRRCTSRRQGGNGTPF